MLVCVSKTDDKPNYEWLFQFPNILIYNNSNIDFDCSNVKIESVRGHFHSVIHYIYNNYENLNNYTIFISDKLNDDNSNTIYSGVIDKIWGYINNEDEITIDFCYISPDRILRLCDYIDKEDELSLTNEFYYIPEYIIFKERINSIMYLDDEEYENNDKFYIIDIYKKVYIKLSCTTDLYGKDEYSREGLNMIVSKNTILSNSKSYYYNILQFCEKNTSEINDYGQSFSEFLIEKILMGKIRNDYSLYIKEEPEILNNSNRNILDETVVETVDETVVTFDETVVTFDETVVTLDETVVEMVYETLDMNDPFNSPDICFRPPNGYCDCCNNNCEVKPKNKIYIFCSDTCCIEHQNSVEKKNI